MLISRAVRRRLLAGHAHRPQSGERISCRRPGDRSARRRTRDAGERLCVRSVFPARRYRDRRARARITYANGNDIAVAVSAAKNADVAIVFALQWMTEGSDVPNLSLPGTQNALIAAVAAANPHTIVVLEREARC